eukprot:788395-Amorphochlora_amoeboformis.AAC.1
MSQNGRRNLNQKEKISIYCIYEPVLMRRRFSRAIEPRGLRLIWPGLQKSIDKKREYLFGFGWTPSPHTPNEGAPANRPSSLSSVKRLVRLKI